jgi:hypothetical protein
MFGDDQSTTIIFLIRPVASGEQLLMDYGPGYWSSRKTAPSAPHSAALPGHRADDDADDADDAASHGPPSSAVAGAASAPSSSLSASSSSSSSSTPATHRPADSAASTNHVEQGGVRGTSLSDIQARARAPIDTRAAASPPSAASDSSAVSTPAPAAAAAGAEKTDCNSRHGVLGSDEVMLMFRFATILERLLCL